MAIEFNCPQCGKLLTTSESRAFATAKCPACGELITVPAGSSAGGVPSPALEPTAAWLTSSVPAPAAVASAPAAMASARAATASLPNSGSLNPPAPAQPAIACPHCASPTDAWAAYCSACGAPLAATAVAPLRYSGFWRRFVAFWIDVLLVSLAAWALQKVIFHGWVGDNLWGLLYLLYSAAFESSPERATLGKLAMGISVSTSDGRRLSFARAALRTLAKIVSLLIVVGFFMPLLTLRKQALHDILTDAVVVRN